jgi:hypothetical protein
VGKFGKETSVGNSNDGRELDVREGGPGEDEELSILC